MPVVGFEGFYEVSDLGRVRSIDRVVERGNGLLVVKGRVLAAWPTPPMGYRAVTLSKGGKTKKVRVHNLVLEAFVGPRPCGLMGCHDDGDLNNNLLSNLRWDTQASNVSDAVRHGTHFQKRKTHCKRGHLFDVANTYVKRGGGRQCRECIRLARGAIKTYKKK